MRGEVRLKKISQRILLVPVILILFIALIACLIESHLLEVGRKERLRKLERYDNYVLTYEKQSRCEFRKMFVVGNVTFYYDCIDSLTLSYGSTKTDLYEVMNLGYLHMKEFVKNLKKVSSEDGVTKYMHESTTESPAYEVEVRENGELKDVIIKAI